MISEICIILGLILLNGFLSASEVAILSSKKPKLQIDAKNKKFAANTALKLKNNPERLLLSIQVWITLIGITIGILINGEIVSQIAEILTKITSNELHSQIIATALMVLIVSYLMLVAGELVPKHLGTLSSESYAKTMAKPMQWLGYFVMPLAWLSKKTSQGIMGLLSINQTQRLVTEEEIKALVDEGVNNGVIERIEHDLVDQVLLLGDRKAINLMVHRSRITYLDLKNSAETNRDYIKQAQHTEYPVCDGSFDNILGSVNIKDLVREYLNGKQPDLRQIMQPLAFVHENSLAYSVLEILKKSTTTQAVVVDEYGTPQGIITFKDIMRSLIGDLDMEESDSIRQIREREDGSFIVDGGYQIDAFFRHFDMSLEDGEDLDLTTITTIGGLVFQLLDHVPREGEKVRYKNLNFEVIDMDSRRVDKLSVVKLEDSSSVSEFTD